MRHSRISRSLASVLALWLAVVLAEPVPLHTCDMHSGLATGQGPAAGMHHHSSASALLASNEGAGHSHHDQDTDSESRQCSCVGACSAGRSPVGVAATGISPLTVHITKTAATGFAYASPTIVAPPFLLPFSNGPPAGSSRA